MEYIIHIPRDINKLCRTCMTLVEEESICAENRIIYNNRLTELSKIFRSVTSLKISAKDGLPEVLCSACIEKLNVAYMFKNQCASVQENFKKLILVSNNSSDSEHMFEDVNDGMNELNDSSELDIVYHPTISKKEHVDNATFICQICQNVVPSNYELSKHMISHNIKQNLIERFLTNTDLKTGLNYGAKKYNNTDNESFIKERKSGNINSVLPNMNKSETTTLNGTKKLIEINSDVYVKGDNADIDVVPRKTKKAPVGCKYCNQEFGTRKDLFSHICIAVNTQEETNTLSTICALCDKTFINNATLSLHFLKHTIALEDDSNTKIESVFFFCEVCGQVFENNLLLLDHYSEQHENRPKWSCSKCRIVYEKEQDLMKHEDVDHPCIEDRNADLKCILCNQLFPSKSTLLQHSRVHLMKKYSCRKCSSSFCTQQSYFAHLKSHPGYLFTCNTCGKCLSTKSALKSHIVGVHSLELRHTCTTCGKGFATANRLKTHSNIHSNHKKYVCTYCGYRAHKIGDLQIHTRIHTSERPYKCTYANCTMSFKTSSHLCDHIRRHLQIRKHKCGICSMQFTTNHGLKIHYMQHTGEKPHSCLVCNTKFRRTYHLKVHMKQHDSSRS